MNRRKVGSYITAAVVLSVLFAAFFAVEDILPIPDNFREIIGFASADTTDVADLDVSGSGVDPQTATSSESTTMAADPEADRSTDSTSTVPSADLSSGDPSEMVEGVPDDEPDALAAIEPVRSSSRMAVTSLALGATPPVFPAGSLLVFRYPTSSGFTVGYTRADDDSAVARYDLLIEQIEELGSDAVLDSETTSTTADSYVASGLSAGAYRVTVTAVDTEENVSDPLVGEVLVGHQRPVVQIDFVDARVREAVELGSWVSWGTAVQVAVNVSTPAPSYQVRSVGFGGLATITSSIESTPTTTTVVEIVGEGESEILISAIDRYSLESSPTAFTLKVDRIAPTAVTLLRATQVRGTTNLLVSWVGGSDFTSGVSHYEVTATDTKSGLGMTVRKAALAGTSHTFANLKAGTYRIDIVTVDVAGNRSTTSSVNYVVNAVSKTVASATVGEEPVGGSATPAPVQPTSPTATPEEEPASGLPELPIETKVNDSNRLYWLIGAVGFGAGLLIIYFTAVARAFSKKEGEL